MKNDLLFAIAFCLILACIAVAIARAIDRLDQCPKQKQEQRK